MSHVSLLHSLLNFELSEADVQRALDDFRVCQRAGSVLAAAGVVVNVSVPGKPKAEVAVAAAPVAKAAPAVAPGVSEVARRFNVDASRITGFLAENPGASKADLIARAVANFGISQADAQWAADAVLGADAAPVAAVKAAAPKAVKVAEVKGFKPNAKGLAIVARQFNISERQALDFLEAHPGSKTSLIKAVRAQFGLRDVEATWAVELALSGKAAVTPAGFPKG